MEEISKEEVIGSKTMNRLFDERIGLSPKKFSQVIRFQSVLPDWVYHSSRNDFSEMIL